MDTGDRGNEWAWADQPVGRDEPQVYVRVWLGPTAVAHYRADPETAAGWVETMRSDRHFQGLRYTINPLPPHAPPTRPLPVWQLELTAP